MKYVMSLILLLVGIYVSVAAYQASKVLDSDSVKQATSTQKFEYHGIVFDSQQSLMDFIREAQSEKWFGWIFNIPAIAVLLIGAMAAGVAGGAAKTLVRLAQDSSAINYADVFGSPIAGLCMGLLLWFLALTIPMIFTKNSTGLRPESVLGFSLFAGVFSKQAYKWIEAQVLTHLFPGQADNPSDRQEQPAGGTGR